MQRIEDYVELLLANFWWYAFNIRKWLGNVLAFIMPVIIGIVLKEAYNSISQLPNVWSVTGWVTHWPILLTLIVLFGIWGLGALQLHLLGFQQSRADELFNASKWMCEDLFTKSEIESVVRCTVWVPVGTLTRTATNRLIQATDYFPMQSRLGITHTYRKSGRRFRTYGVSKKGDSVGILGFTALGCLNGAGQDSYAERLPANVDFVNHMVERWNFSRFKASRLTPDRKAYLCVPLLDGGERKLLGILYLDSNRPRTFSDEVVFAVLKHRPRFKRILTKD